MKQRDLTKVYRVEGGPISRRKRRQILLKIQYFSICDEKNPGNGIIELICYCLLTNLEFNFLFIN